MHKFRPRGEIQSRLDVTPIARATLSSLATAGILPAPVSHRLRAVACGKPLQNSGLSTPLRHELTLSPVGNTLLLLVEEKAACAIALRLCHVARGKGQAASGRETTATVEMATYTTRRTHAHSNQKCTYDPCPTNTPSALPPPPTLPLHTPLRSSTLRP